MKINSTQTPGEFKPGQVILLKNFKDAGEIENTSSLQIDDDVEILIASQYIIYTESHIEIGFCPVEVSYLSNRDYLILKAVFVDKKSGNCTADCAYFHPDVSGGERVEATMKVDLFVVE